MQTLLFSTSDGQKIAKKISKQISTETKDVKELVQEYNHWSSKELTLAEALNPMEVVQQLEQIGMAKPGSLSTGRKRELIDAYLLLSRSKEELAMLEEDVHNIINYYKKREADIMKELHEAEASDMQTRGKKTLLYNLLQENSTLLKNNEQVLTKMAQKKKPTYTSAMLLDSDTDISDLED